ncbi:hypothetical protein E2562_006572 [Oryza meyeriana var. granulata]|uniref:GBF-interacting protein 1 N-terminal domain-containing protein n=1 Tax=Oryza meyeriana var. granulata TaxID=110450 RepID=A0A6G1EER8_9ORYZ|nr:hypothetical protein E2562_006572 [Oryza meyeriana var. granulata]
MRGGGRGGGGRVPFASAAPAEGAADAATIPPASRKLVQGLKGILTDRSEAEIYATLLDCGMDPDVAVERLISQDPFHEVRRKRDKKKEIKAPQETRPRPFYKSTFRGSKTGSDRSGHFHSGLGGDSTGSGKGPTKKETELHSLLNSSVSDSIKESNQTEKISAADHTTINGSPIVSSGQADEKSTTLQPPSQVKHGWGGMSGRPSMADIVKMGRPQAKAVSRSVASNTGMRTIGGSFISNATNYTSKDVQNLVLPSEVDSVTTDKIPNGTNEVSPASNDSSIDVLPPREGLEVPESVATVKQGPSTEDVNKDEGDEDTDFDKNKEMSANSADGLTSSGPYTASSKEIQSEHAQIATHLNNGLIDDCQSDSNAFENSRVADSEGNMPVPDKQFEQLTLHEEKRSKSSEDNPAVIIPDHLQVSNADCAHLTFGSFVSGTLDAPVSLKTSNSDEEIAAVSDNHSIDQSDVRIHEYENKDTVAPAADEHVASSTKSDMENLDITPVQQPELRTDLMDVTNNAVYNLSSASDYATSSAVQQDSSAHIYLQEHRQLQNVSPLSSFMQGNIPNGLLAPALPPVRDFDPAFSLLLTNPPFATMVHGTTSSSMGNATTVSTQAQENVNPGVSSNPQLSQSQPSTSTSVASGPPLPQHLTLHPYAQATLPLGYASMIGYPSLPQSYAYIPPAAFQQPYMNSGLFHQAAAAVPNSNVKYPLPQYKSNVSLASLPQPASLLSSYVGGFGAASSMPGNFALNQSTPSATAAPGYDGTVPAQYKDGNRFVSLQQSENPAMWMHGAGSRTMPPLAANALYGYQGQGHQGGLRQGQLPSQFGAAPGQSQPGLGHEHRNPSDGNLSAAAAQANQMWPNSY